MSTLETPWGPAEHTKDIGGGILRVDTPSHGGYFVPPALNVLVPSIWRESSFNKQAMNGWYEEGCDWFMVALTFPTVLWRKRKNWGIERKIAPSHVPDWRRLRVPALT